MHSPLTQSPSWTEQELETTPKKMEISKNGETSPLSQEWKITNG